MRNYFLFLFVFIFTLKTYSAPLKVVFVADPWCPYTCHAGSDREGILIDVLRSALPSAKYIIEYKNLPWARAVEDTRHGKYNGIVGAFYSDAPDFIFPNKPIVEIQNHAFVLAQSNLKVWEDQYLKSKKIGLIQGYSYGDKVDRQVALKSSNLQILAGDEILSRLVKMLDAGRIDIIIETPLVILEAIKDMKKNQADYRSLGPVSSLALGLHIALSPKNAASQSIKLDLDRGMSELKESGKLQKIFDRYSGK